MTKTENQLTYKRGKHMLITNISWDVSSDKYDEDELNDYLGLPALEEYDFEKREKKLYRVNQT